MGTRYLTAVFINGEYKVAQYGQYDGDPGHAGVHILRTLSDDKTDALRKAVSKCRFATAKETEEFDASRDMEEMLYPQMRSMVGSQILPMILHDGVNVLENKLDLVKENWYSWAYVIDFDSGKFEAYKGNNKVRLSKEERFYFDGFVNESGVYPPRKVAEFPLEKLPGEDELIAHIDKQMEIINQ